MNKITIADKDFTLFISNSDIQQKVTALAEIITKEYRDKIPVFLCVLNGSFLFAADLVRNISVPAEVSFIKLSSYSGTQSTGNVNTLIGLNKSLSGRDIIIVEDIIDTGKTIHELLPVVQAQNPSSIKLATFLSKPEALAFPVVVDFVCFEIPDKFVVGYGLDYNELGRNLPHIYVLAED